MCADSSDSDEADANKGTFKPDNGNEHETIANVPGKQDIPLFIEIQK